MAVKIRPHSKPTAPHRINLDLVQRFLSMFFMAWFAVFAVTSMSQHEVFGDFAHLRDLSMDSNNGSALKQQFRRQTQQQTADASVHDPMKDVPPADVAIFYHVYMHMDDDQNKRESERSEQRAIKIIRQQLHDVAESLSRIPNMKHVHLYYTTVGDKEGRFKVQEICQDHSKYFTCHHLQHIEEGFEEWTLGAMYEYCQDHEDQRVVYLHTKGSYHYSQSQDHWRQHLTKAAMSSDCIQRAHAQGCELCGLMALPRPTLHYTGNMFNADCDYIRKLAHPKTFGAKLESFYYKGEELIHQGILVASLLDMRLPCNTGSGRFAMEHWHGSHPSLEKVCDVSTHYQIEYWQGVDPQNVKPEAWDLDLFPRHPITADWSHANTPRLINILDDESARLREYFLLPGLLTKWYELYGEAPPQSSWVWSWYPDGQFWRRQVSKLGPKAVATVINALTEQEYDYEEEEEEEEVVEEEEIEEKETKEKEAKKADKEAKEGKTTKERKETNAEEKEREMKGGKRRDRANEKKVTIGKKAVTREKKATTEQKETIGKKVTKEEDEEKEEEATENDAGNVKSRMRMDQVVKSSSYA